MRTAAVRENDRSGEFHRQPHRHTLQGPRYFRASFTEKGTGHCDAGHTQALAAPFSPNRRLRGIKGNLGQRCFLDPDLRAGTVPGCGGANLFSESWDAMHAVAPPGGRRLQEQKRPSVGCTTHTCRSTGKQLSNGAGTRTEAAGASGARLMGASARGPSPPQTRLTQSGT